MIETNKSVIDLNVLEDNKITLKVKSYTDKGRIIPWTVDYTSSQGIEYDEVGIDELHLTFDPRNVKEEAIIRLLNSKGESEKIRVLPNLKESKEKKYTFKVRKYDVVDKNKIVFKVTSRVNGEKCKWGCSYKGKPLSYKLDTDATTLFCELTSIIYGNINGHIQIQQDESNNTIDIYLLHNGNGDIEVKEIKLTNC